MDTLLPRLIDEDRVVHKIIEHGSKTRLLSDLEKRLNRVFAPHRPRGHSRPRAR